MRTTRFAPSLGVVMSIAAIATSCASDTDSEPEVLVEFASESPGDIVGLIAVENPDGTRTIEWVDRATARINRLDIDADEALPESFAGLTVGADGVDGDVGIDGDQRGLLGQVMIDGRRFASWTRPDPFELVVGELLPDGSQRIVWSAGDAGDGAIGGVLAEVDGDLAIGVGRNTDWDADNGAGGAILLLDPDQNIGQDETIVSTGYTNPWAYTSTDDGGVWVADNAAGPDPADEERDDIERIGRADLLDDRNDMDQVTWPGRAPSAMVALPDGRIGICGFLDNELRAYDIVDTDDPLRPTLELSETIMPCNTGAAVFDDGTIVTAAQSGSGETLQILRP